MDAAIYKKDYKLWTNCISREYEVEQLDIYIQKLPYIIQKLILNVSLTKI